MPTLTQRLERLRVIKTVRATLVLVLCVIVGALLHLDQGMPLLMTVIILVFFLHDESISAGVQLIVGAVFGALLASALIHQFLEARPIYLMLNLMIVGPLAYWAAQGLRERWPFPFTAVMAILVIVAAAFGAIASPVQGDSALFSWASSCVIGVAILWVVLIGLWPSPKLGDLVGLWSGIERANATLLRDIADLVEQERPLAYRPSALSLMFFGSMARLLNTNACRLTSARAAGLRRQLILLSHIYVQTRFMARSLESLPVGSPLPPEMRAAVVRVLRDLAQALETDRGDLDQGRSDALQLILDRSRALGLEPSETEDQARLSVKLTAFATSANVVARDLNSLRHGTKSAPSQIQSLPPLALPHAYRLQPDSLKATLRMLLGILIGLSIHFLTEIPAGSFLMLGMVFVLVQPNLGRSQLRVRLTLPGVALGTLYSLVGLAAISYLPHFGLLLAWLALGFLIGGYYAAGPDRISYAGIQFMLGMAVILGMAAFPIGTITSAEDRVIGALLGFSIALGIGHFVWPDHPATQLRASLSKDLRRLPVALERLGTVEDSNPAETSRLMHQLKLDVQSNFGLLYDFSYMFTKTVRPAYDYRALVHSVGGLFVQTFTLYEVLEVTKTEDRQIVAQRWAAAGPRVKHLANTLADRIASGRSGDLSAVRADIHAFAQELTADARATLTNGAAPPSWLDRLSLNVLRELLHEMNQITLALKADDRRHAAPSTTSLVRTYEGAG